MSRRRVSDWLAAMLAIGVSLSGSRSAGHQAFRVETSAGVFEAPRLVVATGGLSIAKIGATDFGYQLAVVVVEPLVVAEPTRGRTATATW